MYWLAHLAVTLEDPSSDFHLDLGMQGLRMGWRISSLSKSNFLSHQLIHLAAVPQIHLAMATKPPQLINNAMSIILLIEAKVSYSLQTINF